jgi:hypothetical protein
VTAVAGASGAKITSVAIEGEDAADFSMSNNGCAGKSLTAGARCELTVAAKPTAEGKRTAQLVISDESGVKTAAPLEVFATAGEGSKEHLEEPFPEEPFHEVRKEPSPTPSPYHAPSPTPEAPPPAAGPQPPHVVIQPAQTHGKPRPDLFIELGALRDGHVSPVTHTVTDYRYFFSARNIHCVNGANRVILDLLGHTHYVPCSRSLVRIGGAVTPHKTYTIFVEAVIMRRHRIRKLGTAYVRNMYMPGEEGQWRLVSQPPPVV